MLLSREISKWQNFHMEGLAELNVSSLAVRKYFVFQKNTHSIQLDLLNSGLMGNEPTPLATIKVDSVLTIDSKYHDLIQAMFIRSGMGRMNLSPYLDFDALLQERKTEIITTHMTTIHDYDFKFNGKMQLIQVVSHDKNQNMQIQYKKDQPELIIVDMKKMARIRLQVEQFVNTSCCGSSDTTQQNE